MFFFLNLPSKEKNFKKYNPYEKTDPNIFNETSSTVHGAHILIQEIETFNNVN